MSNSSEPNRQRKFKITIIALSLATAGFLATALHPTIASAYGTFAMALGSIAGLYFSGNVGEKWVASKKSPPNGAP